VTGSQRHGDREIRATDESRSVMSKLSPSTEVSQLQILVDGGYGILFAFAALTFTTMAGSCSTHTPQSTHRTSVQAELHDASSSSEWLTYGHDYSNRRFSSLLQINPRNVSHLIPAYVFQTGVLGPFETTPVVSNGVMYISTAYDGVFAIDARTGDQLWKRPPLAGSFRQCCGPVNRGVAITDDLVIIGQLDGVLVALDRRSGDIRWVTPVADNASGYSITMAPLIYGSSVLIGVAGGEFGIRASLSSYSIRNGNLQWRWYATDPRHWFGTSPRLRSDHGQYDVRTSVRLKKKFADSWKRGGGGIWTTPAIDQNTNTIFVTTGNPWPDDDGGQRPGDNLFTDCIVALDASTGRMRWYFQQTPHDLNDLDAASPPVLFNTVDDAGHEVEAVGEVGKTGFFYELDRATGRLIRRSRDLSSLDVVKREAKSWQGGSGWSPVSFDPGLRYAIVSAAQHLKLEVGSQSKKTSESLHDPGWNSGYGTVSAVDVTTGRVVWQDKFDEGLAGGSVSTGGGVTFVGEGNGYFDALETESGVRLWQFQTGAGVNAAPITFALNNQEYVAVASGGNQQFGTPYGDSVFVFRLGEP